MSSLEQQLMEFARDNNLHYIGPAAAALQAPPAAYGFLQQLVKLEVKRRPEQSMNVLEVGSWAGASTLCIGDALRRFNRGRGRVVSIDPYRSYFDERAVVGIDRPTVSSFFGEIARQLEDGQIRELFDRNLKATELDAMVSRMRQPSDEAMALLGEGHFDLVFVDGDQRYDAYRADLKRGLELLREGGVLCGLGLEARLSDVDPDHARANQQALYTQDPVSGLEYHPGVTCAVQDVLGELVSYDGFWAVRKTAQGLEKVTLDGSKLSSPLILEIPTAWPDHARASLREQFERRAAPTAGGPGSAIPNPTPQRVKDIRESIENTQSDYYLFWITRITGGWLTPGHGNLVAFDYAIAHMPEGGAVLEIGSFLGMSLCAMTYMMWRHKRTNPVFSCDPWDFEGTDKPIGGFFDASAPAYRQYCVDVFKRNIELYCAHHLPYSIEAYSHGFLEQWARGDEVTDVLGRKVTLGGPLSFVYIDGAHTYDAAIGDFNGSDPYLLPGGFVFFDDTGEDWGEDMARVVREVEANPHYELIFKNPNYFFRKRLNAPGPKVGG